VRGGPVGERGARRRRRQPGDVDVVLDRKRQPVQRQRLTRRAPPFEIARRAQQAVARRQLDPHAVVAAAGDTGERVFHHVGRTQRACTIGMRQGGGVKALHRRQRRMPERAPPDNRETKVTNN
jgi:hypothetical protein